MPNLLFKYACSQYIPSCLLQLQAGEIHSAQRSITKTPPRKTDFQGGVYIVFYERLKCSFNRGFTLISLLLQQQPRRQR